MSVKKLLVLWLVLVWPVVPLAASAGTGSEEAQSQRISTQALHAMLEQGQAVCLVNVLPKIIHDVKHIPGSINIPLGKLQQSTLLPEDKNRPIVFYCMGTLWLYSPKAARVAAQMGYSNVMVYREGIIGWARAGFSLDASTVYPEVEIPLISAEELAGLDRSQAVLLDIRPANHFAKGHIQGAVNIDLEDLHQKLDLLPKDQQIVLIDHKGKLTLTTGRFMVQQDYPQVMRLDGGFNGWVKDGRPIFK